MTTIGIIGAGQLGQMLGYAGRSLGVDCVFLDPSDDPPAASAGKVLKFAYDSAEGLAGLANISDLITYEFENVPVNALSKLPPALRVYPPAVALEHAQDRLVEKNLFRSLGIPLPGGLTCEGFFPPPPLDQIIDPIVPNTNPVNCTNDGYVTDSSWGYRIRGSLTYNDVFAGVNLTPRFAWSHDVDGVSPNSNFNDGAKALSVGLTFDYLNRYTAAVDYTSFSGGAYNTTKDRDFVSLSLSVSF